ncbi:cytochrome b-c1 complex subunit 7 [Colletes latitarsis]|uniref:cytochrome b-c1 complex subunit 7 n=1 Tax=Colletes latitarsis TaxID=2605962 RepID=UPI004036A8B4
MSRVPLILKISKRLSNSCRTPNNERKDYGFKIRKLMFNWAGYNKYGLYSHDVFDYADPFIKEALRRLPKNVLDARNFRIMRALQADFLKTFLPKEKWITYEQDLEYRYLDSYLEEIEAERIEIYEFGCVNYTEGEWPAGELK